MSVAQFTPQFRATTAIRPFRFVNMPAAGLDNKVEEANADDRQVVGVTDGTNIAFDDADHANVDDIVRLQPGGVILVEAGAALDAGDLLTPDADGKAIVRAEALGIGFAFARALEDASGDTIIVRAMWLGPVNVNTAVS